MISAGQGGDRLFAAVLPAVAASLPDALPRQRWFGGKGRTVRRVEVRDLAALPEHPGTILAVVDVYADGDAPAGYFLPLSLSQARDGDAPGEVIARVGDLAARDAIADPDVCRAVLAGIVEGRTLATAHGGRFAFRPVHRLRDVGALLPDSREIAGLSVRHANVEQSNSSVIFGERLILKVLRRLASGISPEIEIARFLGERTTFDRTPGLVGWAEYVALDGSSTPVAVLQQFVTNAGDGWTYLLAKLSRRSGPRPEATLAEELAALGRTLGGLHLALASQSDDPAFAPEVITVADLDAWRKRTHASLQSALDQVAGGLSGTAWSAADRVLAMAVQQGADRLRAAIDGIRELADGRMVKTRHHGDFHLGQTLVVADGWIIIDFEGEPLRSLDERRAKQTPLRDVAGLLRSLDYAHATVLRQTAAAGQPGPSADGDRARTSLDAAFGGMRQAFLAGYLETVRKGDVPLLPADRERLDAVLLALETEKALYELAYEVGNRPDWIGIPLSALARLAQSA